MLILPACLLILLAAMPSLADEVKDENAQKCINVRALKRTEVLDDLNILFFMSGQTVYHNILPRQCNGLSRERRFSYTTSVRRLCNFDTIRVLYDGGVNLQEGRICRLGFFRPITKDDAAAIIERSHEPPQPKPLHLPEPQEVGVETDESRDPTPN